MKVPCNLKVYKTVFYRNCGHQAIQSTEARGMAEWPDGHSFCNICRA